MDRRYVLLGLAALSGSVSAVNAQTSPAATAGKAEADYVKTTATVGAASLQQSNIALQKAAGPKVKEFAKFEHDEQTTVAEIFKKMTNLASEPDANAAQVVAKLQSMPTGGEFDKAYVAAQIDGHQKLLAIQESYLKTGNDREHTAIAKLVRGMVMEHLVLLNDLKTTLG